MHKTDFIASGEAGISMAAIAAAPYLEILDRNGKKLDACSSAVLSSDGTLLTAGHCVEACLEGALKKTEAVTRVLPEEMNRNGCRVKINGVSSSMKILATNDCRGEERWASAVGECSGLDYAILKVDNKLTSESPCFAASTLSPPPNTPVGNLGFSVESSRRFLRKGARDSAGTAQYYSGGQTLPFQDYCTLKTDSKPQRLKFPGDERSEALRKQVDLGRWIQTQDSEFLKRGSGGPLIDLQTFELTGIASFYIFNTDVVECAGSTFYSSVASILNEAKLKFPKENWAALLDCRKAIGKGLPFRAVPL